jgi:hypothetical protein
MTGLLFRIDEAECVVRSVGDPPNGVVGVVDFYTGKPPEGHALIDEERFAFVVDPNVTAPPGTDPTIVLGLFENATPISYEDAIRGCPDARTANMLCSMLVGSASVGFQLGAQRLDVEHTRAAAQAIERLRDTVIRSVSEGWGPPPHDQEGPTR